LTDLLAQIEEAWERQAASSAATAILARWTAEEPVFGRFATMHDVADAARGRRGQGVDQWDAVQLGLLRLSGHDEDARLTLLFVVRPGLIRIFRTYVRQWGLEDTASAVVLLALEKIANHPKDSSVRSGAWIVLGVRNELMRRRLKEITADAVLGMRAPMPDTPAVDVGFEPSPSDEVIRLVTEAVKTGRVTERGGRLILLHRVFGVSTREVAAAEGKPTSTVRQYRNRAEASVAEMALAVA
jgi:DNA-directed RNA polymerase specialized sigma24 family protein